MSEVLSDYRSTHLDAHSSRSQVGQPYAAMNHISTPRRGLANGAINPFLPSAGKSRFKRTAALRNRAAHEIFLVRQRMLIRWWLIAPMAGATCDGSSCQARTARIRLQSGYLSSDRKRAVSELRPFLLGLVRSLVDQPSMVTLEPRTIGDKITFDLQVAESDASMLTGENLSKFLYLFATIGSKYGEILVV